VRRVFSYASEDGRLVLGEPTNFAEGTESDLKVAGSDDLDEDERACLDEALEVTWVSAREGVDRGGGPAVRDRSPRSTFLLRCTGWTL
jgi:hypothetical protein